MARITGFLEYGRVDTPHRPVAQRLRDWREVQLDPPEETVREQAARCMDCGVPFCNSGCPLGNLIPDWNDLAYREKWREALERLHSTNNFPEFTGLVCPAPCEAACVLGINQDPVTIKQIEWEIIRRGWEEGWIAPVLPERRSGRTQPSSKPRLMIAFSICLIVTASPSLISSTHAASHGAGQRRPVNSGKLLVRWSSRIASSQRSR